MKNEYRGRNEVMVGDDEGVLEGGQLALGLESGLANPCSYQRGLGGVGQMSTSEL